MQDKETFREKALRRIRSGDASDSHQKKARRSRLLVLVDILLVVLIMLYFMKRPGVQEHSSTSFSEGMAGYRFSISEEKGNSDYLVYLSIHSSAPKKINLSFVNSVGSVIVSHKKIILKTVAIGRGLTSLSLKPGETRTFAARLNKNLFDSFADSNRDEIEGEKRSLIHFSRPHVSFTARLILNTATGIGAHLDFDHGVKE